MLIVPRLRRAAATQDIRWLKTWALLLSARQLNMTLWLNMILWLVLTIENITRFVYMYYYFS